MPEFGSAVFIGGFLFSSIGFVAFIYGKRMHVWRPMFIGLALMAYPYFTSSIAVVYSLGAILTGALFVFRE